MTSNEEHQSELLKDTNFYKLNGYNCYAHNHSQTQKGYEEEFRRYNSYPSQADVDRMKDYGFQYAEIYNESDERYYEYYKKSKVQEEMMDEIFGQGNHD